MTGRERNQQRLWRPSRRARRALRHSDRLGFLFRPRFEQLEDRRLLDIDPFPVPLEAEDPLGSLIYDEPTVSAEIAGAGETDGYTIELDSGQTVTVVVDPAAGLQPTIELTDPGSAVIGIAGAAVAGQDAVLQTVAIAVPGTYTVTVGGASDSTGTYSLQLILNAAAEEEQHDGPSNGSMVSAQDIDASFVSLGNAAQRGAVLGRSLAEPDFYGFALTEGETATMGVTAINGASAVPSLELLDGSGIPAAVGVEAVHVDSIIHDFVAPASGTYYVKVVGGGDYSLVVTRNAAFDVDALQLGRGLVGYWPSDEGTGTTAEDFGGNNDGSILGAQWTDGVAGGGLLFDGLDDYVALGNPASLQFTGQITIAAWIKPEATDGFRNIVAHGYVLSPNGEVTLRIQNGQYRIGSWTGTNYETLSPIPPEDIGSWVHLVGLYDGTRWRLYRNGQPLSSVVSAVGAVNVSGNWAIGARGTGTERFFEGVIDEPRIYNRALSADEIQFLFDNPAPAVSPQQATVSGTVLGAIGNATDADEYSISVVAGDELTIATSTPADGSGQFVNTLDPALDLLDPAGETVASDDNGGPGLNALVTHTAATTGNYTVRVGAVGTAGGEYVLNASGHSGAPPAFEVAATDPADGAMLESSVAQITVHFNDAALLSTLDASDLTVDGVPATAVAVVDGDTAVFDLPAELSDGLHHVDVVGGAIVDLQGTPIEAYAGQFIIDLTRPYVVASSVQEGDVVPLGALVYTAQFNEELNAANLDPTDVRLVGLVSGAHVPAAFDYDPVSSTLTVEYADLPDDAYTLTLISGDGAFEDLAGRDLDGQGGVPPEARESIQFDLSGVSGSYSGSVSPAHLLGDLDSVTETAWNTVASDTTGGLVFADGTTAPDAAIDIGRSTSAAGAINWAQPANGEFSYGGGSSGVYDTALMRDWVFTDSDYNLGVRVGGLAPGDYRVYALVREPNELSRTYDVSIGLNIDDDNNPLACETTSLGAVSGDQWANGQNYAVAEVRTVDSGDWITIIVDPTNAQWGTFQGFQIVPIDVPGSGSNFVVNFSADADQVAYPVPLEPKEPPTSWIYDPEVTGAIGAPGDTDSFTIDLDNGQSITVVVDPDDTLQPNVELTDPDSAVIGSAGAGAAGEEAVLQTVAIAAPGTYTVTIAGAAGTTGAYAARLILNAAVELEEHGGGANDDPASAQDVSGSFISLTTGTAERGAVLGSLAAAGQAVSQFPSHQDVGGPNMAGSYSYDAGTGVHTVTGGGWDIWGTADEFHYAYQPISGDVEITARVLSFDDPLGINGWAKAGVMVRETLTGGSTHAFMMMSYSSGGASLQRRPTTGGTSYSNHPTPIERVPYWVKLVRRGDEFSGYQSADGSDGSWILLNTVTIPMNTDVYVGLAVTAHEDVDHLCTAEFDNVEIDTGEQTSDWYRFELDDGRTATLALTAQDSLNVADTVLELYDGSATMLAAGVPAANVDQAINNFRDATGNAAPDTYYVRVSGSDTEYSLVLTRDADLDTESNDDLEAAQDISGVGVALGYLAGPAPGAAAAGDSAGGSSGGASGASEPADGAGGGEEPAGQTGDRSEPLSEPPVPAGKDGGDKALAGPEAPDYLNGRLIVGFADGVTEEEIAQFIADRGATLVQEFPSIHAAVVELPDDKADPLYAATTWSADAAVRYAEPDYVVHTQATFPSDPRFSALWGMHNTGQTGGTADADIDAPEAWDTFTGSSTVVIAGIDTGVDYNHEDLAANMWVNPGEVAGDGIDNDGNGYIDDIYGIDAYNGDSDPWDDGDHGTHTAGTFGAVGDNGIGVTGVNWDVQIMALKFLGGGGFGSTAGAIECINYMTMMKVEYGVNVVVSNNSWGGGGFSQALEDAIRASNEAGILFVAAAGNDYSDNDVTPHYPSSYDLDGIIAVTATDHNDDQFYNYGATSVDLGAPGRNIMSTVPGSGYAGGWNGTSMATPHVAGAAAFLMAFSPTSTLAEVKAAILDSVDPLPSLEGITVSGGRLNLAAALTAIGDPGDFYRLEVNAGDTLSIRTSTPGDGPYEFENLLDPAVELYDPSGALVDGDDNGAADGRNAQLTHQAGVTGTYTVRVISMDEMGQYVLEVSGSTAGLPPFAVSMTDPADGQRVGAVPTTLAVTFNDGVLLTSLDAADLTIDGTPATAVTLADGDTAVFDLPVLAEGVRSVAIAGGAILDVQGTPIEAYAGQFTIDLSGPRVIASSILEGDVTATGNLAYTAQFDEELWADDLDPTDVSLVGVLSGAHLPESSDYDPATSTLTLRFIDLPEDDYTLTLFSGDGQFEDLVGNDLDGEPDPTTTVPSGDGAPGGDFVVSFSADVVQADAHDFMRLEPLGGMMFASRDNNGLINFPSDEDDFAFLAEAGETIAAVVYPGDPAATLSIELVGLAGPFTAAGPGLPAFVPPAPIPADGGYTVRVSGDAHGSYDLQIGRNLAIEIVDSDDGSELPVDGSLVSLGSGRYGVVGASEPEPVALDSVVWGLQPATGQILLIDPATGNVLYSYAAPDSLSPTDTRTGLSIAEGGRSLIYVNSDVDAGALYRLDPITGRVLSVEATDGLGYDGLGFESTEPEVKTIYSADMDTDPGWTLQGAWGFGVPAGNAGDPSSGHTGSNVIGYNLSGAYPNNMPVYYATTPVIDAAECNKVTLSFYRWLGIESSSFDHAAVQVSNDGSTWTTVWEHTGGSISDSSWRLQEFDISSVAAGQSTVTIRWSMGPTDSSVTYGGWNIDDVVVTGLVGPPPATIYSANMDADPGWTLQGDWGYGVPAGNGGDPSSGHTGSNVIGYNLDGAYPNNMPVYYATTPAIDTSGYTDVSLSFYRWLGIESAYYDHATVEVSNDGSTWTTVWNHSGSSISESAWTRQTLDISSVADDQPVVYVRWSMGPTDSSVTYAGWNIDDVEVTGNLIMPPRIFLNQQGVEVRRQEGFSGVESGHFSLLAPSGAIGGDSAGRHFAHVPGTGIVEFDPETPDTVLNTLPAPAADIEGLAFDGTNLYAATSSSRVYTLDPDTGTQLNVVSIAGGGLYGLGAVALGAGSDFYVPDLDEYTVDLTGKTGRPIDIVLAGQEDADFSSARLELLDTDGTTVLAAAVPDPLGAPVENYDLGILDFTVPADGVYTLQVFSASQGEYAIVLTESLVFDTEPNDAMTDGMRSLDGTGAAMGHLGGATPLLFAVQWQDPTPTTIHTVDPETGAILASFDSPATLVTNPFGLNLAFDGDKLYYNAGSFNGDNTVYVLDARDGTVLDSYTASRSASVLGLGYVGGELFVMDDTQADIDVYVAETGTYVRTISAPAASLTGFTGDDANDLLYAVNQVSHTLLKIDPETGAVLDSASSGLGSEQGMAVIGDALYVSETGGLGDPLQDIVVYDAATLAEVRRFHMPIDTMIAGLGGDGVLAGFSPAGATGLPPREAAQAASGSGDLYQLSLNAGETLLLLTDTPLDGTVNDLDPGLAVFDPSGALVASDTNTEDGKNARLVFTATDSGPYTIEVLADDGGGEYLLLTEVFSEPLPWLRIDDVKVVEGDSGTTQAVLTVSITTDPAQAVAVQVDSYDNTATVVDGDYDAVSGVVLTFEPGGSLTQQLAVDVSGDTDIEPREDFFARLSNPAAAIIADPHGVVTILNDDTEIEIGDDLELIEGDSDQTAFGFAVGLVAPADVPVTVDYTTTDGTATQADLDYAPNTGRLTFEPGEMEKTVTVQVLADTQIEAAETFYLDFSNPSQPMPGTRLAGTIQNDDTEVFIDDVALAEGDAGKTDFHFTVGLAAPSALPVTVNVETIDGSATVKDADYQPVSTTITFEPGEVQQTVTVAAIGDARVEEDETFAVALNAASQPIARARGIGTIIDDDQADQTLKVVSMTPTASGFVARFNSPFDPGVINLYDTETAGLGLADVTLKGAASGDVAGSLVVYSDQIAFVATGGPLADDDYTVTLRSAAHSFKKLVDEELLDGNHDGTPGGDYVGTFYQGGSPAVSVGLPDFARGPGQPVDVPATRVFPPVEEPGLPIRISDGAGVESVDLTILYDPGKLTLTGGILGSDMPSGSFFNINLTTPGTAIVGIVSPVPLDPGEIELLRLIAEVPESAEYGSSHVLDIVDLQVNEDPDWAVADDAIHAVAYFGDTTGNGSLSPQNAYSSLDAQRALRVAIGLDTAFVPDAAYPGPRFGYPRVDPVVLGDVTGNGAISSLDAARILQEAIGLDRPEIPPLPSVGVGILGMDSYHVDIPTDVEGAPGETVTVPINIQDAESIESFDIVVGYDAATLTYVDGRLGDLGYSTPTWGINDLVPGTRVIGIANPVPLPSGGGSIVELDFTINASAAAGQTTPVDFEGVSLNEGMYAVDVLPVDGDDPTDGLVTVIPPANLDIDGSQTADALTDGTLILRYLFGFTGQSLVEEALDPDATRTDPAEIVTLLDNCRDSMLDVDADGRADALTDGILILRYLFGFTGQPLVEEALAPDATRTEPNEIVTFLDQYNPNGQGTSAMAPLATTVDTGEVRRTHRKAGRLDVPDAERVDAVWSDSSDADRNHDWHAADRARRAFLYRTLAYDAVQSRAKVKKVENAATNEVDLLMLQQH